MSNHQAKLVAGDGDGNDRFGESVAVSGDGSTVVVGAYDDEDPNGEYAGSAYVFEKAGGSWTQQAKLVADDGDRKDRFGESVAVSDDGSTGIIGAPSLSSPDNKKAGSAYVFENDGDSWIQQATLAADDGDRKDEFGASVAVSGDGSTTVVGDPDDEDPNGENTGSASVFEKAGGSWIQQATLAAAGGSDKSFGESVAVTSAGSTILIGARADIDSEGDRSGSAYVFERAGGSWAQQTTLAVHAGGNSVQGGVSVTVAVSGDGSTAVVGAIIATDARQTMTGTVSVFEKADSSWDEQAELATGDDVDFFGYSVAVSDDGSTVLIGAPEDVSRHGIYVVSTGTAYVFENDGNSWTQQAKLAAGDRDHNDYFGSSLAVDSDASTAIIGAAQDEDPNGDQAGSAYVFPL